MTPAPYGRLPAAFLSAGSASFSDFLGQHAPDLLPGGRPQPSGTLGEAVPHGTTIVAATFQGGVEMSGDQRPTGGMKIAERVIEKMWPADEFSSLGIALPGGIGVDLDRFVV